MLGRLSAASTQPLTHAARRFYCASAVLSNPAAAAGASAAASSKPFVRFVPKEAVKSPKPVHVVTHKPTPIQTPFEPLRTAADVAKFVAQREAEIKARPKPLARPLVELQRALERKSRGMREIEVKFRSKAEHLSDLRSSARVPGVVSTRGTDGRVQHIRVSLQKQDVLGINKLNTALNTVFELKLTDVPGYEDKPLLYRATCANIRFVPSTFDSFDFVRFLPVCFCLCVD